MERHPKVGSIKVLPDTTIPLYRYTTEKSSAKLVQVKRSRLILSTAPGKFRHLAAVFLSASVFVDAEIGMPGGKHHHAICG